MTGSATRTRSVCRDSGFVHTGFSESTAHWRRHGPKYLATPRARNSALDIPPRELSIARLYVLGKVRLDEVPKLLDTTYTQLEKYLKYQTSPELFPAEMRSRVADWRTIAGQQLQRVRAGRVKF
jgi:hypothetical protein